MDRRLQRSLRGVRQVIEQDAQRQSVGIAGIERRDRIVEGDAAIDEIARIGFGQVAGEAPGHEENRDRHGGPHRLGDRHVRCRLGGKFTGAAGLDLVREDMEVLVAGIVLGQRGEVGKGRVVFLQGVFDLSLHPIEKNLSQTKAAIGREVRIDVDETGERHLVHDLGDLGGISAERDQCRADGAGRRAGDPFDIAVDDDFSVRIAPPAGELPFLQGDQRADISRPQHAATFKRQVFNYLHNVTSVCCATSPLKAPTIVHATPLACAGQP